MAMFIIGTFVTLEEKACWLSLAKVQLVHVQIKINWGLCSVFAFGVLIFFTVATDTYMYMHLFSHVLTCRCLEIFTVYPSMMLTLKDVGKTVESLLS